MGKSGKPGFNPSIHSQQFDMIVIGGGPAGMTCAYEAAERGAKVALCDLSPPTPLGHSWNFTTGTDENVGSGPNWSFHRATELKDYMKDATLFGWKNPDDGTLDWSNITKHIQRNKGNGAYKYILEKGKIFEGSASFKSEHEISISYPPGSGKSEEVITGQCIVIAVGCRPKYLSIPGGAEHENLCITSDDLVSLPYRPGKTVCIGAGWVSAEWAGYLSAFGCEVTILARSVFLRNYDQEMANLISCNLKTRKVSIVNSANPTKIMMIEEGSPPKLAVQYSVGPDVEETECNTVLVAIGREPATKKLNLDKVGVKVDPDGYIIADQFECTAKPHIFAIGDCVKDRPRMKAPAAKGGLYLARRIYDKDFARAVDYESVPMAIFTPIEYGFCGMSEEEAIAKYGKGKVTVFEKEKPPLEFVINNRDSEATHAKLICVSGKEKVVGLHCFGPNAADIAVTFSIAIKLKCSRSEFDELVGLHPSNAESFAEMGRRDPVIKRCCC